MILEETAHAKLNLALHVRRKRADGYHDLETIFAFTELGDRLTAAPADTLSLTVDGPFAADVPTGGDNLILRAARALLSPSPASVRGEPVEPRDRAGGATTSFDKLRTNGGWGSGSRPLGAALHLTKNLPVASGIGGGSADAAAALRLLTRLWRLDRSLDDLAELAAGLGADVPACVHSRSLRGEGRGDALVPIDTGLSGAPVLLVNPRIAVSTPAVFAGWDGVDRGALGDAAGWRNDLESPALRAAPAIADVLAALRAQPGVTLARMSGSGATCFAVFEDDGSLATAARRMRPGWWVAGTRIL